MAPEQVVGEPVDQRTDIFALGAVLYELLTGSRAFHRPSPVETQSAVLTEDPIDILQLNPAVPPAVAAAVQRCLEKNKEERFQSARDLAFHLEQAGAVIRSGRPTTRRDLLVIGLPLAAIIAGALIVMMVIKLPPPPAFQQLTFHRGRIGGARFSTDGIVYSQAIAGMPLQVWQTPPGSPESRPLGYSGADVLATRSGKLALSINRRFAGGERFVGTLAEVSAGGGAPHEILEDVEDADWDPAGAQLAVARSAGVGAGSRLEYPVDHVLYQTSGAILFPRVSRDGQRVAFLEDVGGVGHRGRVVLVGRDGGSKILTRDWVSARGLAWSPGGNEIWFSAADERANRALRAVDLEGKERLVLNSPGSLTIWDAAPDGRVLLTRDDERRALVGVPPGGSSEQDLSWFDAAGLASLSADGKLVLFGDRFGVYVRPTNGDPALKIESKEAYPDDLSPDGSLVLATTSAADQLVLLPTRAGNARPLPTWGIASYSGSRWFPDGRRILFNGREADRKLRAYVVDLAGGPPKALTPEGTWALSISSDGAWAAAIGTGQGISLWPTGGGPSRQVPGSAPGDRPIAWTSDGRALWIFKRDQVPTDIYRLDIATGNRELWKSLVPPDAAGVYSINELQITPSGSAYFYSYRRVLSELYVVSGLR
jgi:Tol biopolymer transport system component